MTTATKSSAKTTSGTDLVGNGVQVIGETFLPGASLLLAGKIKEGGFHTLAGIAAGLVVGPIGALAVAANSFSSATTDKHLHEHFSDKD